MVFLCDSNNQCKLNLSKFYLNVLILGKKEILGITLIIQAVTSICLPLASFSKILTRPLFFPNSFINTLNLLMHRKTTILLCLTKTHKMLHPCLYERFVLAGPTRNINRLNDFAFYIPRYKTDQHYRCFTPYTSNYGIPFLIELFNARI